MNSLPPAILETIVYADLFDYPLTLAEIHRLLISPTAAAFEDLEMMVRNLTHAGRLATRNGYFFLPDREMLPDLRGQREIETRRRYRIVRTAIGFIGVLAWVKLVALTGAAAMANGDAEADVDLLIVTATGRMWLTRFLVFSFLKLLGLKRGVGPENSAGKICVNLWLDEDNLAVPRSEWDLVVAHELAQMKPLVNKDKTYERLIEKNLWLKNFLPNWSP